MLTAVSSLGTINQVTPSTRGAPPQYWRCASTRTSWPRRQCTNLNGPVPADAVSSEGMPAARTVSLSMNMNG
jgi:hypothetical protein